MGYSKEVYGKAIEILDRRARDSREAAASRREEIYRKLPQVAVIEKEMAAAATRITRAVIVSSDNAGEMVEKLGQENLALQEQREKILLDAGYPGDYLSQRHTCGVCRDTGYVGTQMCECLRALIRTQAFAQLSEASSAPRSTFADFDLSFYPNTQQDASAIIPRKRMAEVLAYCQRYAAVFSLSSESLLMLGQTGLGKTHLSLAIAMSAIEAGYGVIYTPVQRLMDKLEAEKFSYSQEAKERYSEHMRAVLECDLLVLDDLGTEFITGFTTSALYNIVNSRLVEGRPTIVSTNLELTAIEEKYSQRMVSRLTCAYKVLKFYGTDIRFIMRAREGKNRK